MATEGDGRPSCGLHRLRSVVLKMSTALLVMLVWLVNIFWHRLLSFWCTAPHVGERGNIRPELVAGNLTEEMLRAKHVVGLSNIKGTELQGKADAGQDDCGWNWLFRETVDNTDSQTGGPVSKFDSEEVLRPVFRAKKCQYRHQALPSYQDAPSNSYDSDSEEEECDLFGLRSLFRTKSTFSRRSNTPSAFSGSKSRSESEESFCLRTLYSIKPRRRRVRGLASSSRSDSGSSEDEDSFGLKSLFSKKAGHRRLASQDDRVSSSGESHGGEGDTSGSGSEESTKSSRSVASQQSTLEVRDNEAFKFYRRDKLQRLLYALRQDIPQEVLKVIRILKPSKQKFDAMKKYSPEDVCLDKRGYTSKEVMENHAYECHSHSEHWRITMAETLPLQLHQEAVTLMFVQGLLHKASSHGSTRCLEALLQEGYDPNVCYVGDEFCKTPLIYAAEAGHADAVDLLIKAGSLVGITNHTGQSVLHRACHLGHINVIRRLAEVPEFLKMTPLDNYGETPLASVIDTIKTIDDVYKFYDAFRILQQAGVKVWSKSKGGESMLQTYVSHSELDKYDITEAFLPPLTDLCPSLDARSVSVSVRYSVRKPTATCSRSYCDCCYAHSWDILAQGPTALCTAVAELGSQYTIMVLLQANANVEVEHAVAMQLLEKDWGYLEDVERTVLQQVCPELAATISKLRNCASPSHMLVTPFQRAMLKGCYVTAAMLVEAGHHVSCMVHAESVRGFLRKPTDIEDNDRELMQLLPVFESPRTLQWWCCRSIRSRLPKGHGTCQRAVDSLPVPAASRRYIALQHLRDLLDEE